MKLHLGTYIKRKHKPRRFIKKPSGLFGLWPPQLLELENLQYELKDHDYLIHWIQKFAMLLIFLFLSLN